MYKQILVPVDLADTDLAKPAIVTAVSMAKASGGSIRLVNVLPMTPVMLAEYVPADFDTQQRKSSEEALAIIQAELPNLVFLDVMMPKKNGFDVCQAVKKELGLTQVHIILLTAKGQEFDRLRGEEVGADKYMTKPFDPDALMAQARAILGL